MRISFILSVLSLFFFYSCVELPEANECLNGSTSADECQIEREDENSDDIVDTNEEFLCEPNKKIQTKCGVSLLNVEQAWITSLCNEQGDGLVEETNCLVESCKDGFQVFNNTCIKNICTPELEDKIDCNIANAFKASITRTCNGDGSAFASVGECQLESCLPEFIKVDNACVPKECNSDEIETFSCVEDIPFAEIATFTKQCNSLGTAYLTPSACQLVDCKAGYDKDGNTCKEEMPEVPVDPGPPGNGAGDDSQKTDSKYVGIPYPTEMLPGGIMPTLPTPGVINGFAYDPIKLDNPIPSGAVNEYVVAVNGNDNTAGNNGKGTVEKPRRTIPEGTFGEGTKIFVYGKNSPYGEVDFNMGDKSYFTFNCKVDNQCFWVGIDNPRIGRKIYIQNTEHLIMDGLRVVDINNGGRPWGQLVIEDSKYITTRNMELRGDGTLLKGGSVISISNTEYLVSHNIEIHHAGKYDCDKDQDGDCLDVHGWRPLYGNRYLWLLDSEIHHLQGDSIQVGNSDYSGAASNVSHYIFVGNNKFYTNYENSIDNKNSFHVIFSGNQVYDFYSSDSKSANGTAIILSNNDEGPHSNYHWAINNEIWDSAAGIRDSGTTNGEKNYIIGNLIWDTNTAIALEVTTKDDRKISDRESWVVHNTVISNDKDILSLYEDNNNNNTKFYFINNITVNGEVKGRDKVFLTQAENNVLFNANFNTAQWDQVLGLLTTEPKFVDVEAKNYVLTNGSPGKDSSTTPHTVFKLFQSLYGKTISIDINGVDRFSDDITSLGAMD